MAKKLVKIKDVYLYTTTELNADTTAACNAARKLLTTANIKFNELWYNDSAVEHQPVLASLSTWYWGPEGSKKQRQMSAFPIVHWTECFDDWSAHQEHAHGVSELKSSTLLKNASLVE